MSHRRRILFPALAFLLLTACSGTDLINAVVPHDGYRVVSDQQYGDEPRQRLDLYIPEAWSDAGPTVVFFYGGNWESGSKEDYLFAGEAFASRGYRTVIPDYRLYPEVRFPAFIEDAAAAVAWVKERDAEEGPTSGPIFLVGHSAGAYIVAMLTLQPRWLAQQGRTICRTIAATVGLAGPYDFLPLTSPTLKIIFGPEETRPLTQPINHVNGVAPPMFLITGRDDTTVLPKNTIRLAARIRGKGGTVEERFYEGTGHVALVASLARPLRGLAPTLDDADGFLSQYAHADTGYCRSEDGR